MTEIVLPPKYYLFHFEDFMREVRRLHAHLLDEIHHHYLKDFERLSEDAKCLLIRMINRTGIIFDKSKLVYDEIENHESSWSELYEKQFVRSLKEEDLDAYLQWLKKEDLKKILTDVVVPFKKSSGRDELLILAQENLKSLEFVSSELETIAVLHRADTIEYMLFLYFGKLQNKLILPTLRDLGIRQASKKGNLEAKFKNKDEARSHYFYSELKNRYKKTKPAFTFEEISAWPQAYLVESKMIREEILLRVAQSQDKPQALEILKLCETYPATAQLVRLHFELDQLDECQKILDRMMDDPLSDEELLFAEDFLARKFQKKRLSILTETLRDAEKIMIDESFYRQPEMGVLEHYSRSGIEGHFSENVPWMNLFWTLFKNELDASSHSEFDHSPPELLEKTFHLKYASQIAETLSGLTTEKLKELFPDDEMMTALFDHCPMEKLREILLYMAQDYYARATGWPDLFVINNGALEFIEVKAEGDSLKASQVKQLRFLEKLGFSVKVLQVGYRFNDQQTYVVVDLETTGTMSSWNRVTEIGAVKMRGNEIIDRFSTLVNPERSIPANIQQLTGISNDMVRGAPKFAEVSEKFLEFVDGSIFVAHNAGFDYGFIQQEFNRMELRFVMPYICTKAWMRKYYPGLDSYGLKNLCAHFGVSLNSHHRALCDAEAAAGLIKIINEKRSGM